MAEVLDSDEYAETLYLMREQNKDKERTMLGHSAVVDALYEVADRVGSLLAVTVSVNNDGKAPEIPPMPRPVTALDRVKDKVFMKRHKSRVKELTGQDWKE